MSSLNAVTADRTAVRLYGPDDDWESLRSARLQGPTAGLTATERYLADSLSWLSVLRSALQHVPYLLTATSEDRIVGVLPLAFVKSWLFGRFLVSLPYVNSAGIVADTDAAAEQLLSRAVELADTLDVRYLELRQQRELAHAALTAKNATKSLLMLNLPRSSEELLAAFKSKLRSQIRSGEKKGFEVRWGTQELLPDFYAVFSQNMRDLGTPVYSRHLFVEILTQFATSAELCVLYLQAQPVAAALLLHHAGVTEVPSASSLRAFNSTNANMVMYWHLLQRAIGRGQAKFDFGRSTVDSNTYRFKTQWGAQPSPSVWQYYVRRGDVSDMRPSNSRFGLAIRIWQKLPLAVANLLGPIVVRGIP